MNAYAMFGTSEALRLANGLLDGFRQEQTIHRLTAGAAKRNRFGAIASAVSSLRAALSAVDIDRTTPTLTDYPYRS
jgi:hypothetical protein